MPSTLTGFIYAEGYGPSTSQSYTLSGTNLTGYPGDITITGSTNYEVSTDNSSFGSSRTVAYSSATLGNTTIYVRLKAGLTAGDYNSENVTNAGGGATTVNVTCSGSVTPLAGWQITAANTLFTIDFDSTVSGVNNGQFAGSGFQPSPTSGRLNSDAWAVTGWGDGDLAFGGTRITASTDYTRGQSNGGVTTGGIYAFLVSTGNRALGFQPGGSDWAPGTVTLKIQNQTGSTVTSISLCYKVYIRNDQERSNSFNFAYSSDNTTYTNFTGANLTSVAASDPSPWKAYVRTISLTGISVSNGSYYYLRWLGADVGGSGSRDEFALDDIKIVVNPTSVYSTFSGTMEEAVLNGNANLSGDATINGNLTITSGLLKLGANTLTVDGNIDISSPGSMRMIVLDDGTNLGTLKRKVASNQAYSFYAGDTRSGANYTPVVVTFSAGTSSSSYLALSMKALKDGNNGSTTDFLKRTWTLTPTNLPTPSYTIELNYVDGDIQGTEGNIWFGKYDSGTWTLLGQPDVGNNRFTSSTLTSFSTFTGGEEGVLPAELNSFTSSIFNNSVRLSWSTAVEQNNHGFDVERKKTESGDWQKIGFVQGHGTTNTPKSYSYSDKFLTTGKYNYRLKQIDFNGNHQYYDLGSEVSIGVPKKFELSQNFPNPFNPVTKINYELPYDSKVSIKVFDMLGREVATLLDEFKTAGYHSIDFDGSDLSSGMYFYRIKTNEFEAIKKMLLLK